MTSSTTELHIDGAGCASCVVKIEGALQNLPGVDSAEMNFADRSVVVTGKASAEAMIAAVTNLGYHASVPAPMSDSDGEQTSQSDKDYSQRLIRNTVMALGLGAPLVAYGLLGGSMRVNPGEPQLQWLLVGMLTLAVMVFAGRHFYLGAWQSVRHHSANMDTLIALGTGTAWLYSMLVTLLPQWLPVEARHVYFEATAMIIGLVNLGLLLESRARGQASDAIKRLIGLQPKTARVLRDGTERDIAIADVRLGDLVRVRPGEKFAVDGEVVEGATTVDESMLTGEPMPVQKHTGDLLVAGTLNKSGSLLFRATRVGKDTALAHIIAMVKRAQNSKPPIGRLADVISAYFVPTIMIISVLSALAWLNFGPVHATALAVVSATTVLIIACPCALGLATPMSVMVGVGKAAESGVLIRNGVALQSAGKITTMVLDKTGTITEGAPRVTDIISLGANSDEDLLRIAASVEVASEHPLAAAIVDSARARNLKLSEIENFDAFSGRGLQAKTPDGTILLGNEKLMKDHDILLGDAVVAQAQALAQSAKTPIYIAIDNTLSGIIAIADPIKPDSVDALKRLKALGIRTVMLTGDNRDTARVVAERAGVDEFFAEVMPEDKSHKVSELQRKGQCVGMVGDGINDAPALAQADVGFAIGSGTDVAIESADITLMRSSLHGLADAILISKATIRNIKQNLFGAFLYNSAGIPVAAGILYPMFGLLLSPIIAGAAMAFSSLTVVANANRLRMLKVK